MRDISTKLIGDSYPPDIFNSLRSELQNAVESADQTLDAEGGPDTDLNMLGKTLTLYGSASAYYQDSGAVNNHVLSHTTNLKDAPAYKDGMVAIFKPANTTTGASTVNVSALGVKNLTHPDGTALGYADLIPDDYFTIVYRLGNDRFELIRNMNRTQVIRQSVEGIVDNDTMTFVFDFEPKEITLQYCSDARHSTTFEDGNSVGTTRIQITAADTITTETQVTLSWYSTFAVPAKTETRAQLTDADVQLKGGTNSVGASSEVEGTATYVSLTHTLTITFQETATNTASSTLGVVATAIR